MTQRVRTSILTAWAMVLVPASLAQAAAGTFTLRTEGLTWEQVSPELPFTSLVEREEYADLDRVGRMDFAVQVGGAPWRDQTPRLAGAWATASPQERKCMACGDDWCRSGRVFSGRIPGGPAESEAKTDEREGDPDGNQRWT